jgi:23S rRNA (uracil1939-C5)-methyltransferase
MQNNDEKHLPPGSTVGPDTGPGLGPEILRIDSIVAGGDGLARHPAGFVVFVPRTAPGERVEVEYTEIRKQYRRARLLRVIEPSPSRRDPPCPYFDRCGGCQLQHLDYTKGQLPAKATVIVDAFKRIGKIEIETPEVFASPNEFGYRNRVSLVTGPAAVGAAGRRPTGASDAPAGISASGTDHPLPARITAGYHRHDDAAQLVEVERCPLAEPPINEAWAALRAVWDDTIGCLPEGPELRLTFRVGSGNAAGLAVEGGRGPGRPEKLLELADNLVAVWRLGRGGDIVGCAGAKTLEEHIGPYKVPLAGTAFLQVNRAVAARLDAYVKELCVPAAGRRIVDAYCGFGLRALDLARLGATVAGIEHDHHAAGTAKRLARQLGIPVRLVTGDVEHNLGRYLPADLVILNPPRYGVTEPVIDTLLEHEVPQAIYVSCNPATLARDVKRLSAGFRLESLRAFDLFPQTAHVETVAVLNRAG